MLLILLLKILAFILLAIGILVIIILGVLFLLGYTRYKIEEKDRDIAILKKAKKNKIKN